MIPFILAAIGGYLLGDSMKDSEKFADGGNVWGLKNYNVTGTFYLYYTKLSEPPQNIIRHNELKSFEKSVMATSQDEAEDIAIDEIMEEHQGYTTTADIYVEDVVETGRYADGGLPFQIEHKVMAKGGDIKMAKGGQVAKKAILIDSQKETITEITISNSQDIYEAIDAELFEIVNIDNNNDLYVDEEGLYRVNANSKFFVYDGYPQPLIGNGLILGLDMRKGDSKSTNMTVEEVKKKVKFLTLQDVRNYE